MTCRKCGADLESTRDLEVTRAAHAATEPPSSEPVVAQVIARKPPQDARQDEAKELSAVADIEPLLAEEARSRIADDELDPPENTPLRLLLNFPRAMVAGYGSIVEAKLENIGEHSLEHLSLVLESNGLGESVQATARHLGPGNWTRQQVEVSPAKAGNFVLRCNVKSLRTDQAYAFRGTVPITINVVPEDSNFTVNISDIQCVRGDSAHRGGGAEFAPVNISSLVPSGTIRSLNDLLNVSFPESYGTVPLELDYEVSQVAMERHIAPNNTAWSIPTPFLGHVQGGTKLKLEPVEEGGRKAANAIHLVARDEFRLGRSRQDADFLTWFWPRSAENDERTKRLSKVHVLAEAHGPGLILRDAGSANRSTFEAQALDGTGDDAIEQRGTLILGSEYHVDVAPFESTLSGELRISNERTWSGPPNTARSVARGSVRFTPVNSEIALYNAVWIFTDANFGCSRLNAIVLDIPGAADVEGRFYYYRNNFWVEALSTGQGVTVDDYKLRQRDVVPLVNGTRLSIAGHCFRAIIEP